MEELTAKLDFKGKDIFFEGRKIFTVPWEGTEGRINLLGICDSQKKIYVGSGQCCFGPVSILDYQDKGNTYEFTLDTMRLPDFNVYDILPVDVDYNVTGFPNQNAFLAAGFGCAGAGIRLISSAAPKTINVIPIEEYRKMSVPSVSHVPHLKIDDAGKTYLELYYKGHWDKFRNSPLLSAFVEDSKDLTHILEESGMNLEKTIQLNRGYCRIRH